jgi:hypothetical protein
MMLLPVMIFLKWPAGPLKYSQWILPSGQAKIPIH